MTCEEYRRAFTECLDLPEEEERAYLERISPHLEDCIACNLWMDEEELHDYREFIESVVRPFHDFLLSLLEAELPPAWREAAQRIREARRREDLGEGTVI